MIARLLSVRLMKFVLPLFVFCTAVAAWIPAQPVYAAIVDVSGIEVPQVNGPVCANCDGAGCNQCQPQSPDPDPEPDPDPTPTPAPQPTPPQAPTPAPPPPPVDTPQQRFEREKSALADGFSLPLDVMGLDSSNAPDDTDAIHVDEDTVFGLGPVPPSLGQIGGLTEDEWKQAGKAQWQIDSLAGKWPLTADEIKLLEQAESQRNRLWKKAVSISGLTAQERERLRLEFHVRGARAGDPPVPTIAPDKIEQWQKVPPPPPYKDPPTSAPVPEPVNPVTSMVLKHFMINQPTAGVELAGELYAEKILDDAPFGNVLGLAKIAVAYKQGGTASARAATADFLVGLIPIPQGSFTVEAGRQYANVAFEAQNRFMTDAMKATGGEFDKEKFWSDFRNGCTTGQKALMEWIGYGTD